MRKMSNEEVCAAIKKIGDELAAEYGLQGREVKENDFWGDKGSEIITWGSRANNFYVEYRKRFSNPVIEVCNGKDYCSVELSRGFRYTGEKNSYGHEITENDNIYRPQEFIAMGANGVDMLLMLKTRVENATNKASNDFVEE